MPEIQIPEPIFLERLGGEEVYGFGQDGDVTISSSTSLTRDMYYNDLTINSSCDLDTNGYKIFVKGTLTFTDATSRIGRFSNKSNAGTLKGGSAAGTDSTDTLGGRSAGQLYFVTEYNSSTSKLKLDGTDQPSLTMYVGNTYTFDQTSYFAIGHRVKFSTDSSNATAYTTGVTESGTLGDDAKTTIAITDSTPSTLYYYDESQANAGGTITVVADEPNKFFSGSNEFYNLTTALTGVKFDSAAGQYKSLQGGSGGSDGAEIHAPGEGSPGNDSNWSDRNVVGAGGGKGASGNSATPGTGAVGGGVVVVIAKNISGNGTIRADGDDATAPTQGATGTPAPNATTPGNTNTHPGNNYSYGYSYGYSYPGNNYSYGYSYPGNTDTHPGNTNAATTHYHYAHYHNPSPPINNYVQPGFSHQHYHLHPGNTNPTNYSTNPTNYGSNSGSNPTNYGSNFGANNATNPTNYGSNPSTAHPGGAGGYAGKAKGGFNAGGGTVILVTGTKPLPGSLTLAASAGTSGAGTATEGTVVTVFNIAASDTDPGA